MLLQLWTCYAPQNMSLVADICFEESQINEQLLGLHYEFVIWLSFASQFAVDCFSVQDIIEYKHGEYDLSVM